MSQELISIQAIPIDNLFISHDPFDKPNQSQFVDSYHREGIEMVKDFIEKGCSILPILVKEYNGLDNMGRSCSGPEFTHYTHIRLDGFKRLMAYKEMGYNEVECIVDSSGVPGGQENVPWYYTVNVVTNISYIEPKLEELPEGCNITSS